MADEDREIFDAALSQEPSSEPPPAQTETETVSSEPKPDATGRLHGEGGKFAPKTPKEEVKTEPAAPEVKPEPDHRIPLAEHLSEREKRQKAEREAEDWRRQHSALQRQIDELRKANAPKQPTPDIFENPEGFVGGLEQKFENRLREQEANFSLRLAHRQYGKDFEAAYQALIKEGEYGNRQAVQQVMNSADPGESLMRWHKQTTLFERTGGDLDKYLEAEIEKRLGDDAFLAQAVERVRAKANGTQPQRVQLPPSIGKIAPAAPTAGDDGDLSDAGLLKASLRR